jgi:hypothetical protein
MSEAARTITYPVDHSASIAETIAALFGCDGKRFHCGPASLVDVCNMNGVRYFEGAGQMRWVFEDQSVIVVWDSGWDIGYRGCFCGVGEGHDIDCPNCDETDWEHQGQDET